MNGKVAIVNHTDKKAYILSGCRGLKLDFEKTISYFSLNSKDLENKDIQFVDGTGMSVSSYMVFENKNSNFIDSYPSWSILDSFYEHILKTLSEKEFDDIYVPDRPKLFRHGGKPKNNLNRGLSVLFDN